jgi:hypothetical protein
MIGGASMSCNIIELVADEKNVKKDVVVVLGSVLVGVLVPSTCAGVVTVEKWGLR